MDGEWRCGGSEFQTTDWSSDREAPSAAKHGCSDSWNKQITWHSRTERERESGTAGDTSHCVKDIAEVGWTGSSEICQR